jgi:hypothetical protein
LRIIIANPSGIVTQLAVRPRPRPLPNLCGHGLAVPERRRRVLCSLRDDIAKDGVGSQEIADGSDVDVMWDLYEFCRRAALDFLPAVKSSAGRLRSSAKPEVRLPTGRGKNDDPAGRPT